MGMGPAGVFVVESPGVKEVAGGYTEALIVTEMLKLIGMPPPDSSLRDESVLPLGGGGAEGEVEFRFGI